MKKIVVLSFLLLIIGLPLLGLFSMSVLELRHQANPQTQMPSTSTMRAESFLAEDVDSKPLPNSYGPQAGVAVGFGNDGNTMILPEPAPDSGFVMSENRLIVKTANLNLTAENTRNMVNKINEFVGTIDGLVTNSNIYETSMTGGDIHASLTVRIPVDRLDEALNHIRDLAVKVTHESVSASDQTERIVDIDAQLRNLQASESRLLTLMEEAETVGETLQVQRELSQTRTQIERLTAQKTNLESSEAMAVIQIEIATQESALPIVDPERDSIWEEIKISVRNTINLYQELLIVGLKTIIILSPILAIGAVIWFIRRLKAKKVKPLDSA